jgi:hypothetical protein
VRRAYLPKKYKFRARVRGRVEPTSLRREKIDKSPGRVEPTSPRMESPDLKNLRKRDIVQELG